LARFIQRCPGYLWGHRWRHGDDRRGDARGDRPECPELGQDLRLPARGKDNFPADREAAEKLIELGRVTGYDVRDVCRANRAYLVRVVRTLTEAGVRQFLGST
jgi:hypothetical protein